MPLSEHEQRLLEQMEKALYAEDPKLASTLRGANSAAAHRRRIILGALGFLLGVALLLTGVTIPQALVGGLGFVVMLASAWWIITGMRARGSAAAVPETGPHPIGGQRRSRPRKAGVMQRFEQRWERRRDGDQL